tara:strand:- start:72924 stop:73643 length:720 start_codon:yes stop_codon:yes gene_type:complete
MKYIKLFEAYSDSLNAKEEIYRLLNTFQDVNIQKAFKLAIAEGLEKYTAVEFANLFSFHSRTGKKFDEKNIGRIKSLSISNPNTGVSSSQDGLRNISELPEFLFDELKNLSFLGIQLPSLKSIPRSVGNLKKLQGLSLTFMGLTKIPNFVFGFTKLKTLALKSNNISEIPNNTRTLSKLELLDLSGNKNLTSLPDFLFDMPNLKDIKVIATGITEIPELSIGSNTFVAGDFGPRGPHNK